MNPPALLVDPGYWLSCDEIAELLDEIEPLTREIVNARTVDDGPPEYAEPGPHEAEALAKRLAEIREERRQLEAQWKRVGSVGYPPPDCDRIDVSWTDCDGKQRSSRLRLKDGKWYRYTQKRKEVRTSFSEVLPHLRQWMLNVTDPVYVYNPMTGSDESSPLSGRPLGMIQGTIEGGNNAWGFCGFLGFDENGRPIGFPAAWLIFRTALRKKHPMAFYSEREGHRGAA